MELPAHDGALGVIRLHLFHLLQTVSPNTVDLDVGVPARGLHGEAYRGHVFWDELFVLPLLTCGCPALARALLRYRSRRLPAARRAARAAGLGGAMFPWQSGSDGREESQRLHLNPGSGRWLPDAHRAPAAHQRRRRLQRLAVLPGHGRRATSCPPPAREMLLEAARFLRRPRPATTRPPAATYIRGVVGPDEFHTGYPDAPEPGIDDNAYTNVMTAWVLQRALEVLDLLPCAGVRGAEEALRLRPGDVERWRDITHRMTVPFHADGVISQFAGYERLAELDWDGYRARYGDLQRLDRILEAEGDCVNRYQVSKQADVLMLFYLLSADELREVLSPARLQPGAGGHPGDHRPLPDRAPPTGPRSAPSSTPGCWPAPTVTRRWTTSCGRWRATPHDIQGGTTAEGIHLGAMSGSVDIVQRCFAGVETHPDVLWVNPHWPASLGPLVLDLTYRGQELTLNVTGSAVTVRAAAGPGRAIRCGSRSTVVTLQPGATVRLGPEADMARDRGTDLHRGG